MINLPVSEAYAFDYLSVLYSKQWGGLPVQDEIGFISKQLNSQLGETFEEVIWSPEYGDLQKANNETFEAIDRAHRDEISASEVQRINQRRYLAKRALQNRFWPNEPLIEQKQTLKRLPLAAAAPTVPPSSQRGDPAL